MDFSKLRKIENPLPRGAASPDAAAEIVAVVRVTDAGYRPRNIRVRADIDDHLFTAEFPRAELARLEADPGVVSVSPAQPLPLEKEPLPGTAPA